MRIIQTNKAYFPVIGGVETVVATLATGLQCLPDLEVEVLACNSNLSFQTKRETIQGVPVTYVPSLGTLFSLPISPMYFRALQQLEGDILHIHEPFPLADLAFVLQPLLWKKFRRIIVSWHSDIVRQKFALRVYAPLLNLFLEKVDKIIVATPNHIKTSEYLLPYKKKCEIIPYGIDLDWAHDRIPRAKLVQEYRTKFGSPLVLFVGRLVYYKGLEFLLRAIKRVANANLLVVGSGPLQAELQNTVRQLGLETRVSIIPHVPIEDLHAIYEAADIFVLPSTEVSEAFGIVQVEAMACGKPVISTNLPTGITFVNQNGITGITVPPKDEQALAAAINHLLVNPDLCIEYGRAGQEWATQKFSSQAMIKSTADLYRKIL